MDEKAIWRDWSPPKEAKSASASGEKGSRPLISRSAPKRVLDCSWVLDARLSRKDSAATSEAMPITTQAIERSSLPKLRPPSRQATRQTQGATSRFMANCRVPRFRRLGLFALRIIGQSEWSQQPRRPRRFRKLIFLNFVLFVCFVVKTILFLWLRLCRVR